jgi:hypothetical protein
MRSFIIIIFFIFIYIPAHNLAAQDIPDLISLGVGYSDLNDNEEAADLRLEYRWGAPLIWVLKPWVGIEATSQESVLFGGGILADIILNDSFYMTPSIGIGLYHQGAGKDLGLPVQFRTQFEAGYVFKNKSRLGISYGHISNASLHDDNPGTEILGIYIHMPAEKLGFR